MENLALTTLLLPFIGALVVSFSPQRRAAEWGVLFAALTTLCMLSLISAFYQADKVAVTLTLVNVGDVALFGLVIDRVSTLILFVVVFLGLLVTIYSTGYLTDKIANTRITARIVITHFCCCLSARWRDWYSPRRCSVSCCFLKLRAAAPGR
ncbi:hydrogenase 4 membrane subunit [Escherichia coli]|uniref:Hydrogenase 4 membrane subunit n=1 Tax=Escherichia coli TaxID=562 RepID=A0A376REN1_ECOLX|nr:hydrogenase 4 membrane subunit [Escherichia coli]